MEFEWKTFPIIVQLMLSCFFAIKECSSDPLFDVIIKDLEILNATCKAKYSCESRDGGLKDYGCDCDSSCSLLGTCCVDSKYKRKYPQRLRNVDCRSYNDGDIYCLPMVYNCDPDMQSDKTTEELCRSNGELLNDPFLNIPVTDPVTGISYKNYYCFACNENFGEKEPMPWNLIIESYYDKIRSTAYYNRPLPNLHFDKARWLWIMDHDLPNATDVSLYTQIPEELKKFIPYCSKFSIISECSTNWTDDNIRNKCLAYMALATIQSTDGFSNKYYQNPHCAICNYQSIEDIVCGTGGSKLGVNNNFFYESFALRDRTSKFRDLFFDDRLSGKDRQIIRTDTYSGSDW